MLYIVFNSLELSEIGNNYYQILLIIISFWKLPSSFLKLAGLKINNIQNCILPSARRFYQTV